MNTRHNALLHKVTASPVSMNKKQKERKKILKNGIFGLFWNNSSIDAASNTTLM